MKFLLKVARNGGILASMYFVSVWATTTCIEFLPHIKPILIFLGTYILTELAKRYKLDTAAKNRIGYQTLLW